MTVDEAFEKAVDFGLGVDASVSGHLVVSGSLTYLCSSELSQQKAILVVAPWLVDALLELVPVSMGSMHLFSGQATVSGQLVQSGLGLVPLAFYRVTNISFNHDGNVFELRA